MNIVLPKTIVDFILAEVLDDSVLPFPELVHGHDVEWVVQNGQQSQQ